MLFLRVIAWYGAEKFSLKKVVSIFTSGGDMSIVGPRPERPEIAAEYEKEMPEFRLRLQARAGLTGYAQVYGKYNTTPYDKEQIKKQGGDPQRETLDFVRAKTGEPYFIDSFGEYWRAYHYVEDAYALEEVKNPQDFYESAVAFGRFQRMLADFPADRLKETIEGFHDTKARFKAFEKAVEEDVCGRAAEVQKEIQFVKDRYDVACVLGDLLEAGELPLRVTHNDTKSNNVLIDNATGKGLCVIDLDTVMPGLAVNDFGDSIRFGASTGAEDEKDLTKVSCDLNLYDVYAKGFVEGCGGALTEMEIECLPIGAKVMTYECGMRFLTDYLSGDTYFKIDYPTHNLDRTRTQLKLVWDMEQKWEEMQEIVRKYKFL